MSKIIASWTASLATKALKLYINAYLDGVKILGRTAMNAAGEELGMTKPGGKQLSDMSWSEIMEKISELNQQLIDAKVAEHFLQTAKDIGGNVQQAMELFINMATGTLLYGTEEICNMPGISAACAASDFATEFFKVKTEELTNLEISKGGGKEPNDINEIIDKKYVIKNRINTSMDNFLHISKQSSKSKLNVHKRTKKRNRIKR